MGIWSADGAYGILVMGIGFAVFVIISSSQKEKEEKKKEFREMKLDYRKLLINLIFISNPE